MKVLHIYKTYYPDTFGGIEEAIRVLCNGMSSYGFDSEVFVPSRNPQPTRLAFEEHWVNRVKTSVEIASTPFSLQGLIKFRAFANQFDLLHFHHPYPFADIMHLASMVSKPTLLTYHADIVRQKYLKYLYSPVQQKFLNSVDKIVCTSDVYLDSSKVLQQFKSKTQPIRLGLNDSQLQYKDQAVIRKWHNSIGEDFVLFLGSLRQYKGIDILLKAAKNLDTKIVIAGGGENFERYRADAIRQNLSNIIFTGRINNADKSALLELCTCLVLPSLYRSEAFGLVLLEAAMRSKPLISTELGTGTSYVNAHEKTGLVIPPKSYIALKNAIAFMVENPDIAQKMGRAARQRYLMLFTAEAMCKGYDRVYRELLKMDSPNNSVS